MPRHALSILALLGLGCAIEGEGRNPFDTQGSAPPSLTAADDPDANDAGADDDAPDESSSAEDDGESSTAAPVDEPASTEDGDEPEGTSTGLDPSADSDADAGEMPGGQPAEGMYSACTVPADCVGVTLCVTVVDPMQMPLGGFCTSPACANADVDCDAAPGGTATPMCLPLTVNDMPDAACALDCTGGKTCPTGMECLDVTGGSICV